MKNIELKLLLIVLLVSTLGLIGWSFDWMFLTNVSKSFIPMAPLTSILFLFSGTAYILFLKKASSSTAIMVAHFLTYFSLIFLTIVLVDSLFKLNWNIENIFIKNPELFDNKPIGRISKISSILFYLLNISFLLTPKLSQNNYKNLYGFLTSIIFYATSIFLIGFIENSPVLYDKNIIPIALNSALCFWLMSLVQLFIIKFQFWPFYYLTGNSIQHKLIRIFLPIYFIFFTTFEILKHHFFTNPTEIFSTTIIFAITILLISLVTIIISRNIEKNLEKANQNLMESEERYKNVVDMSPSAIFIHINGKIVFQNPAVGKIIGGSETHNIIGRLITEFIYPDDIQMVLNRIKNLRQSKEQTPLIVERLLKEDGTLFYGEVTSFLIDYNEKNAVLTIVNDVTERRKTELVTNFYQNISAALLTSDSLVDILKTIRIELSKIMRTDNFYIAFYNEETDMLKADIEVDEIDEIDEWKATGSLTGYLMQQQVSMLFSKSDILKLNKVLKFDLVGTLPECWLGVPLIENDKPIGALVVQSYNNPKEYTKYHESILQLIANQLSSFIKSKENEKQIIESEERLNLFFSQSLDGFFFMMLDEPVEWNEHVDKEKTLEYVFKHQHVTKANEAILNQYLATENQFIGITPQDFFAHDIETGKQVWTKLFDNGKLHVDTFEKKFNGTDMIVEGDYICMYNSQNQITGLFGIQRDVTVARKIELELIEAKEKAEESEESFRGLFHTIGDAIYIQDFDSKFIDINDGVLKMYGYEKNEIIGNTPEFLSAPGKNDMMAVFDAIDKVKQGIPQVFEFWGLRKNGEIFPKTVRQYKGSYFGKEVIITLASDISIRKKIELELLEAKEKAEESERLKSAFLANMSHEIRTPMNSILGFSDLLMKEGLSEDKKEKYHEIVNSSGKRLMNLISDIIDISKIDAHQLSMNFTIFNLNNLIDNLNHQFKISPKRKNTDINAVKSLKDEDSFINCDETRLTQVLSNLLENALKFTHDGTVEFGYELTEKFIHFRVKDSGVGINEKDHQLIFDRFGQSDNELLTVKAGSGLGLSISKGIVEILGGTIWVESELNKGAAFHFTIPHCFVTKESALIENKDKNSELETDTTVTILIAEDELSNYYYLEAVLEAYQFNLIHVENGQEAVEFVKLNNTIDLILMDFNMPVMNGIDATIEIRKINKSIPIIALTAYAMSEDKERAIKAGCNDYLPKPVPKDLLLKSIHQYLQKAL